MPMAVLCGVATISEGVEPVTLPLKYGPAGQVVHTLVSLSPSSTVST